jgi:hypothetical protein
MYNTADKLGISLDRFPAHVTELKDRIDALRNEIDQIDVKKATGAQGLRHDFRITPRI